MVSNNALLKRELPRILVRNIVVPMTLLVVEIVVVEKAKSAVLHQKITGMVVSHLTVYPKTTVVVGTKVKVISFTGQLPVVMVALRLIPVAKRME